MNNIRDLQSELDGIESAALMVALINAKGYQENAAIQLSITVRSLRGRLDRLGLREWARDLRCRKLCCFTPTQKTVK